MGKKPKKPRRKKEEHPTLFVFQNSIRYFEEGSMLELHSQVSEEDWNQIVEQTIAYKIYVDCLKEYACPALNEDWTADEDWYRVQLDVAVSRIRNIDPLLVAKYDQKSIKSQYIKQMKAGAEDIKNLINEYKAQAQSDQITKVTDL